MFGKNTNGVYNIDISHPLNPILGLAIAIPQLDREDWYLLYFFCYNSKQSRKL